MSERYNTLKRIRWPSKQPLIFNDECNEMRDTPPESDNHLQDFEIVGDHIHVEKIRKIFEDSATTVSIVEEMPPLPMVRSPSSKSRSNMSISGGVVGQLKPQNSPSFHKIGRASKGAFFSSLHNVLEENKTDDGVSSDSGMNVIRARVL